MTLIRNQMYYETRMHSGKMRTARSSSRHGGGVFAWSVCGPGDPPGSRHSPEQVPPRSRLPPGTDPPGAGTSPMDRQTRVKT